MQLFSGLRGLPVSPAAASVALQLRTAPKGCSGAERSGRRLLGSLDGAGGSCYA